MRTTVGRHTENRHGEPRSTLSGARVCTAQHKKQHLRDSQQRRTRGANGAVQKGRPAAMAERCQELRDPELGDQAKPRTRSKQAKPEGPTRSKQRRRETP
jgi:hypothetical protein